MQELKTERERLLQRLAEIDNKLSDIKFITQDDNKRNPENAFIWKLITDKRLTWIDNFEEIIKNTPQFEFMQDGDYIENIQDPNFRAVFVYIVYKRNGKFKLYPTSSECCEGNHKTCGESNLPYIFTNSVDRPVGYWIHNHHGCDNNLTVSFLNSLNSNKFIEKNNRTVLTFDWGKFIFDIPKNILLLYIQNNSNQEYILGFETLRNKTCICLLDGDDYI